MEGYYEYKHDRSVKTGIGWIEHHISMPAHFHSTLELMYCAEGELSVTVEDKTVTLHPGEIMVASSFDVHAIKSVVDGIYYCLQISRYLLTEWNETLNNYTFSEPKITDDEAGSMLAIMRLLYMINYNIGSYKDLFSSREEKDATRVHLAIGLMNLIMKRCTLVPRRRRVGHVPDAVSYIQHHFREKLLLPDIARALLCNAQQLSLQFRETMHTSISGYINDLRTVEAQRLITRQPELSLSDVAELCGFQSMRSMLRAFRSMYGCTPSEMKQNTQTGANHF